MAENVSALTLILSSTHSSHFSEGPVFLARIKDKRTNKSKEQAARQGPRNMKKDARKAPGPRDLGPKQFHPKW